MDKRLSIALAILGGAGALALVWRPAAQVEPALTFAPPSPSSSSRRAEALLVYVAGAVKSPGVYSVPAGSRAVSALKAAGGATSEADLAGVNLAEKLEDGQEVLVPDRQSAGQVTRHGQRRSHGRKRGHGRHRKSSANPDGAAPAPVDLNRADASMLSRVPGIGEALATRIITFRELNGPFGELNDLLDVGGMSQSRLDRATPYLRTSG